MVLSTAEEFLLACCMTLSLIDLGETSALDIASHYKIAAQSLNHCSPDSCVQLCFVGCSLNCIHSLGVFFPYVVAAISTKLRYQQG